MIRKYSDRVGLLHYTESFYRYIAERIMTYFRKQIDIMLICGYNIIGFM